MPTTNQNFRATLVAILNRPTSRRINSNSRPDEQWLGYVISIQIIRFYRVVVFDIVLWSLTSVAVAVAVAVEPTGWLAGKEVAAARANQSEPKRNPKRAEFINTTGQGNVVHWHCTCRLSLVNASSLP